LIQHMTTSNPSAAYVQRVSQVFSGTSGDMKSVIAAILTDPEARANDNPSATANPSFGHLREPLMFLTDLAAGLNGTITASNSLGGRAAEMGEDLFNPPTVFSYFSPLYKTENGLLGPEFQIYSTQTASDRADTVTAALYATLDPNVTLDLTPFTQRAGDVDTLADYISYVFLHSAMSANLRQAVTSAANAAATPAAKAQAALYIALTSSEYQVIH